MTLAATPSLSLFAGNQVFLATEPCTIYVGTNPPVQPGSVIRYEHSADFGVQFYPSKEGWSASASGNIRHFHSPMREVVDKLARGPRMEGKEISGGVLSITEGLHIFYFGMYREQFQAIVSGKATYLRNDIEFRTDAQIDPEDAAAWLERRFTLSQQEGNVDAYNSALLETDLGSLLSRPKTRKIPKDHARNMGDAIFVRIARNHETGKLIAAFPYSHYWPLSLEKYVLRFSLEFDTSDHTLVRPRERDFIPGFERTIDLFNNRAGSR